jgi:Secretion system C-terminal sorting domain
LLPVTLVDFKATKLTTSSIKIQWTANREINFNKFEIERSIDGVNFNIINTVVAQNLINYTVTDFNLPTVKTIFYRLKLIDIDGKFTYSKIVTLPLFNNSGASLFPNPATDKLQIKLLQPAAGNCSISIYDGVGKKVMVTTLSGIQNFISLPIQQLAVGKYYISIQTNNSLIQESFIKTK